MQKKDGKKHFCRRTEVPAKADRKRGPEGRVSVKLRKKRKVPACVIGVEKFAQRREKGIAQGTLFRGTDLC